MPLKIMAVASMAFFRSSRDSYSAFSSSYCRVKSVYLDLSVREPLPLSPGDVFRDGAAFLLGQAGHDGDEQLPFAVQGVDILLLEVDLHAPLLQPADGGEAVHGIPGEAAHTFCDDEVDLSRQRIRNHAIEAVPILRHEVKNVVDVEI